MPELLEGQYLELCNDLKDKYDTITNKLKRIEAMEIDMKKDMASAYGVVRLLDHLISNSHNSYDNEVMVLIECLRGLLSDCMDKHIFNMDCI